MKNTFGSSVCVTLFGESHGRMIGAVLDGLAPGIPVDEGLIARQLDLRRPAGRISCMKSSISSCVTLYSYVKVAFSPGASANVSLLRSM